MDKGTSLTVKDYIFHISNGTVINDQFLTRWVPSKSSGIIDIVYALQLSNLACMKFQVN